SRDGQRRGCGFDGHLPGEGWSGCRGGGPRAHAHAVPRKDEPKLEASVHGLILMNGFYTSDDMNNSDVPQFALPTGEPARTTTSATVRQSRVTVTGVAQDFADGTLTGELDVDFFGGQQPSTGGRTFALLGLRRA